MDMPLPLSMEFKFTKTTILLSAAGCCWKADGDFEGGDLGLLHCTAGPRGVQVPGSCDLDAAASQERGCGAAVV